MGKSNKRDKARFREKRGTGKGKDYIPWIRSIEVSGNRGRSHRVLGIKTGRHHELFSDNEEYFFLLAEWMDDVIDIREQFPLLPIEETELIADELNVQHPSIVVKKRMVPGYKDSLIYYETENVVMTTDFLLTLSDGTVVARAIKTEKDLEKQSVINKFHIEATYWQKQGVEWKVVSDKDITKTLALNLKILKGAYVWFQKCDLTLAQLKLLKYDISDAIDTNDTNFVILCHKLDAKYQLNPGTALNALKLLIWTKDISTNLNSKINFSNIKLEMEVSINVESINLERCRRRNIV